MSFGFFPLKISFMCLMSSSTKPVFNTNTCFVRYLLRLWGNVTQASYKIMYSYFLAMIFCQFSFDVILCKFKRIEWNWIFCIEKEVIILCLTLHNILIFFVCFTMAIWITKCNSRLLRMKDSGKSYYVTPFNLYTFW